MKDLKMYENILIIKNIMNMKDLKMYEAPASEVVELDVKAQLLAGSFDPENPKPGDDEEF